MSALQIQYTECAALLIVDMQPDFMPGGALEIPNGDEIVKPIAELMTSGEFTHQIATQDWHPSDHVSFASQHEGKNPFDTIQHGGHDQILWPDHCIQGTPGAALCQDLPWHAVRAIIRKGIEKDADSYSGFQNNWNSNGVREPTGLAGYLREQGIHTVYVCGLARDVCALWTALDATAAGFTTYFLWDLTRAVNTEQDNDTWSQLTDHGVSPIYARR